MKEQELHVASNGERVSTASFGSELDSTKSSHTISMWVNTNQITQSNVFLALNTDTSVFIRSNAGEVQLGVGGAGGGYNDTGINLTTGWQHYVFVWDVLDATLETYWNATLISDIGTNITSTANGDDSWDGQIDEIGIWNRTLLAGDIDDLYNSGAGLAFGAERDPTISMVLVEPVNDANLTTSAVTFNSTANPLKANLTNMTLHIWYSNESEFNVTTNTVTGKEINWTTWDITGLVPDTYSWNVQSCGVESNDSSNIFCNLGASNFTFTFGTVTLGTTFNSSTYETQSEQFTANISILEGFTLSSPRFFYDDVEYTATSILDGGNNYSLTSIIDVPTVSTSDNKTFFFSWLINGTSENSTLTNQTIDPIVLAQCNATYFVNYTNYTFLDETDLTEINATFLTDWDYFLGNGGFNETLDFQDTSENNAYGFCFDPPHLSVNVAGSIQYSASSYPQRRFDFSSLFSNSTSNITLFSLNSDDGIFAQYQIVDSANGTQLSGVDVTVQRTISGTLTTIETDISDDSGVAILFLNPDFSHTFTFVKSGWNTLVQSIQPTSADIYTVLMESTTPAVTIPQSNQTNIAEDLVWTIDPTFEFLNNGTNYDFIFNVNNSLTITAQIILENSTTQIGSVSGSGTALSLTLTNNTLDYDFIKGTFNITTTNETLIFTRIWNIENYQVGDFSLWAWLQEWDIQAGGQVIFEWIKILIVSVALIGGFFVFTKEGTLDSIDSAILPIIGGLIIIWIFSIAGWLNATFFPEFGVYSGWLNKHGIATLMSLLGIGFLGWRFTTQ
jgi:hypothetical protein